MTKHMPEEVALPRTVPMEGFPDGRPVVELSQDSPPNEIALFAATPEGERIVLVSALGDETPCRHRFAETLEDCNFFAIRSTRAFRSVELVTACAVTDDM